MTRILAIGECMVEMAPQLASDSFAMGFAGDTFNTAWYLRKLLPEQDQVGYFTAVGDDPISDRMVGFLDDAGINTQGILRVPDRTVGLYMIQLKDGERSFAYWRGQSAARSLAANPADLKNALSETDMAYFSGITIAILPPKDRANLLTTLDAFRQGGGQVVFDPNLRPKLWASDVEMTEATMQAAMVSDIVLPSHDDEATWFGDADPKATAKRYASTGATCVIVKNGADEMVTLTKAGMQTHAPLSVGKIIDTTAAGDSFNAGFLSAHLAGQPLQDCVAKAAKLAANVIQHRGALVDIEAAD